MTKEKQAAIAAVEEKRAVITDVADSILRFAPIDLDKTQYASIHGANEHIKIQNIGQCVCFYKDFIKQYQGV